MSEHNSTIADEFEMWCANRVLYGSYYYNKMPKTDDSDLFYFDRFDSVKLREYFKDAEITDCSQEVIITIPVYELEIYVQKIYSSETGDFEFLPEKYTDVINAVLTLLPKFDNIIQRDLKLSFEKYPARYADLAYSLSYLSVTETEIELDYGGDIVNNGFKEPFYKDGEHWVQRYPKKI